MDIDVNSLATISTSDGAVVYTLTADDVLWTMRSAVGETLKGGNTTDTALETELVVWTLTQRFVLYNEKDNLSYLSTLRSFSQPVNPIWLGTGSMCKDGGQYSDKAECSLQRLAIRKWYHTATVDQLLQKAPVVVDTVLRWAYGQVDNRIPRVTDFAAAPVAKNFLKRNPNATLYYKGENWYIVGPTSKKWPDNYVTMSNPNGSVVSTAVNNPAKSIASAVWVGVTAWWHS